MIGDFFVVTDHAPLIDATCSALPKVTDQTSLWDVASGFSVYTGHEFLISANK